MFVGEENGRVPRGASLSISRAFRPFCVRKPNRFKFSLRNRQKGVLRVRSAVLNNTVLL